MGVMSHPSPLASSEGALTQVFTPQPRNPRTRLLVSFFSTSITTVNMAYHRTQYLDMRTDDQGLQFIRACLPAPPPLFHGTPEENVEQFIYHLSLNVRSLPPIEYMTDDGALDSDRNKVVLASSFLRDEAFAWFLELLKANAEDVLANAGAGRADARVMAAAVGVEEGRVGYEWTGFPFVTTELESFSGFVGALRERFGQPDPPVRVVTPTEAGSDVTVAWE